MKRGKNVTYFLEGEVEAKMKGELGVSMRLAASYKYAVSVRFIGVSVGTIGDTKRAMYIKSLRLIRL